jgi:hypothetical protein
MFGKKAQIATEYILITGFILIAVTIIFTYSYLSNDQNIRASQANNALDKMVVKADLVYALGPDNNQLVRVTFPRGIVKIQDITVCDGSQQHYDPGEISCGGPENVKAGAIEMQLSLIGGVSILRRPAKAEIELDGFWSQNPAESKDINAVEGSHIIKVFWCGEKICLKRA